MQGDDGSAKQGTDKPRRRATAEQHFAPEAKHPVAPEIDWRSITDPAERRRQRRLAKNRVTAARSRERKKVQWAELEARLAALEADNSALRSALEASRAESAQLRQQLGLPVPASATATTPAITATGNTATATCSAAAPAAQAAAGCARPSKSSTEPAELVIKLAKLPLLFLVARPAACPCPALALAA